jgi:hypothetical protein
MQNFKISINYLKNKGFYGINVGISLFRSHTGLLSVGYFLTTGLIMLEIKLLVKDRI